MDSALLPRVKSEEKEPVIYDNMKLIVSWDLLNPERTTIYSCSLDLFEERKEVRITPPPNPPNTYKLP